MKRGLFVGREIKIDKPYNKNVGSQNPNKEILKNNMEYLINHQTNEYFIEIERLNSRGVDDSLPFFVHIPPAQGFFDINSLAVSKSSELIKAFEGQKFNRIESKYDIITIIPFRNRGWHIQKTIDSLLLSSNISDKKIGFLVVEHSQNPIFDTEKYSDIDNLHYIWIDSKGLIFNKCFCHNIGSAITDSEFIHFHDCDLIVPSDFYNILDESLSKNPCVQCFSGRRVLYMDESSTKYYHQTDSLDKIDLKSPLIKEGSPGAPGGSIAISRDIFEEIGGFDPHFFWAYSIEDRFFWEKAEKIKKFTTLEDPKVDLFHLWHPPGWGKNPYERFEQRIFQIFSSDKNMSDEYIRTAKRLYLELIERHVNNDNI